MGVAARTGRLFLRVATAALPAVGVRILPAPESPRPALESLCAALHRLDTEIARLRISDKRTPALFYRLQSATLAYDWVLCDTCQAVGLRPPGPAPYSAVDRLEVEAGLAAAGVDW